MQMTVEHQRLVRKGRSLSLRASLLGFVVVALAVNAGLWAAAVGAERLAGALHGAVIGSGVFVVLALFASVIFHWFRVMLPRD